MATMKKQYAVYKGDDLLAIGTAEEIAEKLGIKKETVYFYASPTHKKRGKPTVAIPLD